MSVATQATQVAWSAEGIKQRQTGRDWDTETSVIILMCGTTSGRGSVVWRFENKSFLTQENQAEGNSRCRFTKDESFDFRAELKGGCIQTVAGFQCLCPIGLDTVKGCLEALHEKYLKILNFKAFLFTLFFIQILYNWKDHTF